MPSSWSNRALRMWRSWITGLPFLRASSRLALKASAALTVRRSGEIMTYMVYKPRAGRIRHSGGFMSDGRDFLEGRYHVHAASERFAQKWGSADLGRLATGKAPSSGLACGRRGAHARDRRGSDLAVAVRPTRAGSGS